MGHNGSLGSAQRETTPVDKIEYHSSPMEKLISESEGDSY